MLHPTLFLGLFLSFFFNIFILMMSEYEAQAPNRGDGLLFHRFGHCFQLLLSVLMHLQQLQDFSGEGSGPHHAVEFTSHPGANGGTSANGVRWMGANQLGGEW